jgi:hypothetical protein
LDCGFFRRLARHSFLATAEGGLAKGGGFWIAELITERGAGRGFNIFFLSPRAKEAFFDNCIG